MTKQTNRWSITVLSLVLPLCCIVGAPDTLIAQLKVTTDQAGLTLDITTAPAQMIIADANSTLRLPDQAHTIQTVLTEFLAEDPFATTLSALQIGRAIENEDQNFVANSPLVGGQSPLKIELNEAAHGRTATNFPAYAGHDEFAFLIALPDNSAPSLSIEILSSSQVKAEARPAGLCDLELPEAYGALVPEPRFSYVGSERGVHIGVIKFQPFYLDENQCLKTITRARIRVKFSLDVPSTPNPNVPRLFSSVVNRPHLEFLGERRSQSKPASDVSLKGEHTWFSVEQPTVKLTTVRDGVAAFSLSDMGPAGQGILGRDPANLRLFYDGDEQALHFEDDGDGRTSAADKIYFLGRRSTGESTYYDIYSNHAVFFLTWYESENPARRLQAFPQPDQVTNDVVDVEINQHMEEDRFYNLGDVTVNLPHSFTLHRSEDVVGEGWFWADFSRGLGFERLMPTAPSERPGSSLDFVFGYKTISDDMFYNPDHLLEFFVNGEKRASLLFDGYRYDELVANIGSDSVLAGANMMTVRSLGAPQWRDSVGYVDVSAIDYLALRGRVKPFAWRGQADFLVPEAESAERLRIAGFSDRQVHVLDSENDLFTSLQAGRAGVTIRAGARGGAVPTRSIYINDQEVHYDTQKGELAAVYENGAVRIITIAETRLAYDNAGPGTTFVLLHNADTDPSTNLRNAAGVMGISIPNSLNGNAWMGATIKGGQALSRDGLVASFAGFLAHSSGKSHELALNLEAGRQHQIMATDAATLEKPEFYSVGTQDLRSTDYRADLIIITHSDFRTEAERLAQYRREKNGLDVEVVDVDAIFTQYNHGRKNASAIKDFLTFAYANWKAPAPEALILFGDASWDVRQVAAQSVKKDFVPSFGRPVSDYWYSLVDGPDFQADLMVGRISVETIEEARILVDKIIDYEKQPKGPWQKNFLFLAGGNTDFEIRGFRSDAISIANSEILSTPLCGAIDTVFKANASNVSTSQGRVIREKINRGAVWVNYVGHAAPTIFDMDFGDANELNNGNRFPILATFSCQTAAFGEPAVVAKNEEFVREPGRGMVAALGTTGFGNVSVDNALLRGMLAGIRFNNKRRLGDILYAGKLSLLNVNDTLTQDPFNEITPVFYNTVMQYSLIGDPYLELPIDTVPNLYVLQEDVTVLNAEGRRAISEQDETAYVSAIIRNGGVYISDSVIVRLEHSFDQKSHVFLDTVPRECFPRLFSWELDIVDQPGRHKIVIQLDPFEDLVDSDRDNNTFEYSFSVFPEGVFALDPLPHWNVTPKDPVFRVMTPRDYENFSYEFALSNSALEDGVFLRESFEEASGEFYSEWRPDVELESDKSYWLYARSILKEGQRPGDWLIIPFVTRAVEEPKVAQATLRSEPDFTNLSSSFEVLPDGDSVMLAARNQVFPLEVRSSGAFWTRTIRLQIGDSLYVDDDALRGIHVFVFPRGSEVARFYQRFDTYDTDSADIENLIDVVRNEAGPNELFLLTNTGDTWRKIEELGFVEQYREALKSIGAQYADSLGKSSTYMLFVRDGNIIHEEWRNGDVDDTQLLYEGTIEAFPESYALTTPLFGPSQEWRSFKMQTAGDENASWNIEVYGADASRSEFELLRSVNATEIDLSNINVAEYPWIRFEIEAVRADIERELFISDLAVTFVPEAELAIVQSKTSLQNEFVQRGEKNVLQVTVENLSTRAPAQAYSVEGIISPASGQSGNSIEITMNNPVLEPMQTWTGQREFETASLAEFSDLRLTVAPERLDRELYDFNNSLQFELEVLNDVIDPTIRVLIDGEDYVGGRFTHNRPRVRVELYDESPLPVLDVSNLEIELRRRGPFEAQTSMIDYTIELVNDPSGFKVVAEFDADLQIGDNPLTIEGFDATGNSTTATFNLVVSGRADIGKPIVAPNPIADNVSVQFSLVDSFLPTNGWIEVFDLMGGRVASVSFTPEVGLNTVEWNMRAGRNQIVAQGTYYLRVHVLGGSAILYSETIPIMFIR